MKLSYAGCATLAPAMVFAVAFAMPEPTQHLAIAADNWSPAPTAAPQLNIFGREAQQASQDATCGYVSGLSASSITCPQSQICATNTFYGVHSCCPSSDLSACTIATTCIASSAMSSLCTNDACSSDNAIAKCTQSSAMECYRYLFSYDTTIMTQHGCTATGTTMTIPHSYGLTSSPSVKVITVTETPSPATTPTSTSTSNAGGEKKQSLGPIIGGTVGACTIISIVALIAFLVHRRRQKAKQQPLSQPPVSQFYHNAPEFDPNGFPTATGGWTDQDIKNWQQSGGVYRPGTGAGMVGVSEVHGEDRAVEVEAPEKNKMGQWQIPGTGAVEVEAPVRNEKYNGWRGPVEAPS